MFTALTILILILVVIGFVAVVIMAINGCLISQLSLMFNGKNVIDLIEVLVTMISKLNE